jgi:acyl-CoA thioesterase FadM
MAVTRRFEADYRVRFDESGADGNLRSSGYLRYAQDLAWRHSETAGFDRDWYQRHGLLWLVRCVDLEIREPVANGATLTVSTEVIGWRRVWARRESTFRLADDGSPVASAHIDWVLMNAAGHPARVPKELSGFFSDGTLFKPARVELGEAPETARRTLLSVRPQDLDPMAHVNNATYVDYLEDALLQAGEEVALGRIPRRYQLEYIRSAELADELLATSWADEGGWAFRLSDGAQNEVLRARFGHAIPSG